MNGCHQCCRFLNIWLTPTCPTPWASSRAVSRTPGGRIGLPSGPRHNPSLCIAPLLFQTVFSWGEARACNSMIVSLLSSALVSRSAVIIRWCAKYPAAVFAALSAASFPLLTLSWVLLWPLHLTIATLAGRRIAFANLFISSSCLIGFPPAVKNPALCHCGNSRWAAPVA